MAHTRSWPSRRSCASVGKRPDASAVASSFSSGCGALPTVQTIVRAGISSPLPRYTPCGDAARVLVSSRNSTPRFCRTFRACAPRRLSSSGRMWSRECTQTTRRRSFVIAGKKRTALRTRSLISAAVSTPEKPPPTTTNVSSAARSSASGSSIARSRRVRIVCRSSSASATFFIISACSAMPGMRLTSTIEPSASTRCFAVKRTASSTPSAVTVALPASPVPFGASSTRPMSPRTTCVRRSRCRSGLMTCDGDRLAPTTSGSSGWNTK